MEMPYPHAGAAGIALAALVALPAVSGGALLVAGRRTDRFAGFLAVAVAVVACALAAVVATERPVLSVPFMEAVDGGSLGLTVDGVSAVLVVTVTAVTLAVVVFATADLPADTSRARFFGYVLVFLAAMLLTVTASTVPALLFGWEVMGAMSYALIGFHWHLPAKISAGTTAFITTRTADLGMYVAAGAVLAGAGTLDLTGLIALSGGWGDVAAAGLLVAALGKSAQLPFSAWLSAAMEGPSPVSALLHSATMVAAGGYLLIRAMPLLESAGWAAQAAAWIGVTTALLLGAVACAHPDLKQALAASTAAQIGFVVVAAGVGATAGGIDHLVGHAGVKAGLFVAVGAWLTALGATRVEGLQGAGRRYPATGVAAAAGCLVLGGIPPFGLWATKDEILAATHGTALLVAGLAASALAAVYAGRILVTILGRQAPERALDTETRGTRRVPAAAPAVAAILAATAAGLGALALPPVAHAAKELLGATGEPAPNMGNMVLSGSLATVAFVSTLIWRRSVAGLAGTPLSRWAGLPLLLNPRPVLAAARIAAVVDDHVLDRAASGVACRARRLATAVARSDDHIVDRGVTGVAFGAQRLATVAARGDDGGVDRAVWAVASAFRRLGHAARRPQTGLLHQYYVLTAGGLAVLLALLVVVDL